MSESPDRESLADARVFPIRRWSKREQEIIRNGIGYGSNHAPGAHDPGVLCWCSICCLAALLDEGRDLFRERRDES